MNQRLIIALILSVLVMFLYQALVGQKARKEVPQPKEVEKREGEDRRIEARRESREVVREERGPVEEGKYQDVTVDTPLYTATFTTYGGRLRSWSLKKYMDRVPMHPLGRFVQNLVGGIFGRKKVEEGPPKPVDIVNTRALEDLPLGMRFTRRGIGYDEGIPYVPSTAEMRLEHEGEEGVLSLQWRSPAGERIERRLKFYADSYKMDMEIIVSNYTSGGSVRDTLGLEWAAEVQEKNRRYGFFGPIYYGDKGLEKVKPKKLKGEDKVIKELEWFAFDEDYFISLMYPSKKGTTLLLSRGAEETVRGALFAPVEMRPGDTVTVSYTLFLGPKVTELLGEVAPTAKKANDYGWFSILAVPMLKILKFCHGLTGNYGLDIILLSMFLKIIFTPLTLKSQRSMKEMQKLQPEVKRLQEKYKNDKQRLNKEVMELYKRRKVNPVGGCLTMLPQLPVFFALYRALLNSIELRHSPFILWIRDLAAKDPTYITPLLMGGTMYLQQKMSTGTMVGDPTQAKMMSLMPLFFTFIFLSFPSGLVLYWLVTNVLAIGHQAYINRKK